LEAFCKKQLSLSDFQLVIRANNGEPNGTAYMAKYSGNAISIINYNGGSVVISAHADFIFDDFKIEKFNFVRSSLF